MCGLASNNFLNLCTVCSIDQDLFANFGADDINDADNVSFLRFCCPAAYKVRAYGHCIDMRDMTVEHMGTITQLAEFFGDRRRFDVVCHIEGLYCC
ncbi:hypothetical protein ES703_75896 [subsurface metagenome]